MRAAAWLISALLTLLAWTTPGAGQAPDSAFTLVGRVVDAATQRPIIAAVIKFPDLRRFVFSDVAGQFEVPDFPAGTWSVVVEQLGYHTREADVEVRAGDGLIVPLEPDPVALEGFGVRSRSERLIQERRRMIPYRVTRIAPSVLAESVSGDPAQVFRFNANANVTPCGRDTSSVAIPGCVARKGRVARIAVYLDEVPLMGGMVELSAYPAAALHSMEWIPAMAMLRVYSRDFIGRLDSSRISLEPLVIP